MNNENLKKLCYVIAAATVLHPAVSSAVALCCGLLFGVIIGNPFVAKTKKLSPKVLSYSIIGIGASMNFEAVLQAGKDGIVMTFVAILVTMVVGALIGKLLRTDPQTSVLVSAGTAICGGSAIAAVSAAIGAKDEAISVSLACVFLLNALALVIFPHIGHHFDLTQHQFGVWSGIAIHDTSSVVGAALQYGEEALQVATTTKLARALWIVPLTLGIVKWEHSRGRKSDSKPKFPTFILGFLATSAAVTFVPALQPFGLQVAAVAKRTMVLALFLTGSALTRATLKKVGLRPFLQGFGLWILVSATSLALV